jgi:hypothetical protein
LQLLKRIKWLSDTGRNKLATDAHLIRYRARQPIDLEHATADQMFFLSEPSDQADSDALRHSLPSRLWRSIESAFTARRADNAIRFIMMPPRVLA